MVGGSTEAAGSEGLASLGEDGSEGELLGEGPTCQIHRKLKGKGQGPGAEGSGPMPGDCSEIRAVERPFGGQTG